MKRTLAILGAAALFLAALPSQAITLSIAPPSQAVTAGSPVSVDLVISGLGNGSAPSLGAFDVDVGFDPAILGLISVLFGNQLNTSDPGTSDRSYQDLGTGVNLFEVSLATVVELDTLQAASFTLATLTFNSLAAGTSGLDITVNALGDANGDQLDAVISNGSITVKSSTQPPSIPEPATLPLLGIGLLGMIALAMRRERSGAGY